MRSAKVTYKITIFLIVALACAFFAAPSLLGLNKGAKVNLGLDLQGGLYMLLDVKIDEAINSKIKTLSKIAIQKAFINSAVLKYAPIEFFIKDLHGTTIFIRDIFSFHCAFCADLFSFYLTATKTGQSSQGDGRFTGKRR